MPTYTNDIQCFLFAPVECSTSSLIAASSQTTWLKGSCSRLSWVGRIIAIIIYFQQSCSRFCCKCTSLFWSTEWSCKGDCILRLRCTSRYTRKHIHHAHNTSMHTQMHRYTCKHIHYANTRTHTDAWVHTQTYTLRKHTHTHKDARVHKQTFSIRKHTHAHTQMHGYTCKHIHYANTHTQMHGYTRKHIHYANTRTHTHRCTGTQANMFNTQAHTRTHTHRQTCTHVHTRTQIHYTHNHTQSYTQANMYTRTHTYVNTLLTRTYMQANIYKRTHTYANTLLTQSYTHIHALPFPGHVFTKCSSIHRHVFTLIACANEGCQSVNSLTLHRAMLGHTRHKITCDVTARVLTPTIIAQMMAAIPLTPSILLSKKNGSKSLSVCTGMLPQWRSASNNGECCVRKYVCRVGQNHTFIGIYGAYTVFLAGKSPYIRSYTVCIYSSGQPYMCVFVCVCVSKCECDKMGRKLGCRFLWLESWIF